MKRKPSPSQPNGVLLGVIAGAYGLKGEVKVKTFTAAPESIGRYGELFSDDGRSVAIASLRGLKSGALIARLKGVSDRKSAEKLKGMRLYIGRSALPKPKRDEFYHADLVGLRAEDGEGKEWGRVRAIYNFGAGDLLEIEAANGGTTMIPFSRAAVPVVDIAHGRLVALPPRFDED